MFGPRFVASALVMAALLALTGCARSVERPSTPTPTTLAVTPTPTPTTAPKPLPTATPTTAPKPLPTATPTPTPTLGPTPPVTPTPTTAPTPIGLFLRITNLPREGIVRIATIPIEGITTPDAIVSVNGVVVDVEGDGSFATTVSLQEGLNLIEVIASDFQGTKVSSVMTIIFFP